MSTFKNNFVKTVKVIDSTRLCRTGKPTNHSFILFVFGPCVNISMQHRYMYVYICNSNLMYWYVYAAM